MGESSQEQHTEIAFDEERSRYTITVDGTTAGFALVERPDEDRVRFVHTEIDPAFKGRGLAELLVSEALAQTAREGVTAVPLCPFVAKHLREHEVEGLTVEWPPGQDGGR